MCLNLAHRHNSYETVLFAKFLFSCWHQVQILPDMVSLPLINSAQLLNVSLCFLSDASQPHGDISGYWSKPTGKDYLLLEAIYYRRAGLLLEPLLHTWGLWLQLQEVQARVSTSAGNEKMEGNPQLPEEEEIQKLKAPEWSLWTLRQWVWLQLLFRQHGKHIKWGRVGQNSYNYCSFLGRKGGNPDKKNMDTSVYTYI